jgi:hypothetical protein
MTDNRCYFHLSWKISVFLLCIAMLFQSCGGGSPSPASTDCETMLTVYNTSADAYFICKPDEATGSSNLVRSSGLRQYMSYYKAPFGCFDSNVGTVCAVVIYDAFGTLVGNYKVRPYDATSYYTWDGTAITQGQPK